MKQNEDGPMLESLLWRSYMFFDSLLLTSLWTNQSQKVREPLPSLVVNPGLSHTDKLTCAPGYSK